MPYSVSANKVTTLEFDLQDVRSLLAERSQVILGDVEQGFDRRIEIEPRFMVDHGEAALTGIRVVITDTLSDQNDRIRPIKPSANNVVRSVERQT